jgi:hypothetical protein
MAVSVSGQVGITGAGFVVVVEDDDVVAALWRAAGDDEQALSTSPASAEAARMLHPTRR